MRGILGINSIYIQQLAVKDFNNFKKRKPNLIKDKKYEPTTFIELYKSIKKLNLTEEQLIETVYQAQLGWTPIQIWKNLHGENIKISNEIFEEENLALTDEDLAMFDLTKLLEA